FVDVVLPFGPAVYAAIMAATGDLRPEHLVAAAAVPILRFASKLTKRLVVTIWPMLLMALGYDAMRYARPFFDMPSRVLGCEVRGIDLTLFGVGPDMTVSDYFAIHHAPVFDLYFAIPYAGFFIFAIGYGAYLFFADPPRLRRFVWTVALVYLIAFATWLIMPVAPPWYLREHGCAILAGAVPSAAGLLRVDQYLGIHYFREFYARAPDVFAAIPSLHCAFPMFGVATAWRVATWRTWPIHLLYVATMFTASVYLGHHWIVDGLAGWLAVLVAVLIVDRFIAPPQLSRETP
ncbi:MAG: phosphatase PAP2 family protein, partial [Stellaceae bacterium]